MSDVKKLYEMAQSGELTKSFELIQKVAKNSTKEEFELFIKYEELPPIPLSIKEKEVAKMGIFSQLGSAFAVVSSAIGYQLDKLIL